MPLLHRVRLQPFMLGGLFLATRLAAQDITVGDPQWFLTTPAPEQLRTGDLDPAVPDELKTSPEIALAIVSRHVDENGKIVSTSIATVQPPLRRAIEEEYRNGRWTMPPIRREGKRVDARVQIAVIFNPKSAARRGADATPRLLAASAVITSQRPPTAANQPPAVRMKLSIDAAGAIAAAEPETTLAPKLLADIQEGLKAWKFAPARKGGQPVAAEVSLAVLCTSAPRRDTGASTPARLIEGAKPEYPLAMRRFGINGSVLFDFTIDAEGRVQKPVIIESDNPAFDENAMLAVRKWKYQPATRDGSPVSTNVRQSVLFNIANGDSAFRVSDRVDQSKLPPEFRYDTPPKIRGIVLPVYPHALRTAALRGRAKAAMLIDPSGVVRNVKVLETERPEFGLALAAALQGWKFDPAYREGKPVPHMMNFEQAFNPYDLPDEAGDDLIGLEKKSPDKITPQGKLDAPLKAISQRQAQFPVGLPADVERGEAVVECLIDKQGRVRLARIKSASHDAFGYAAVQAASAWWFEVPLTAGKPTVVREEIPFKFVKNAPAPKAAAPANKQSTKKQTEAP